MRELEAFEAQCRELAGLVSELGPEDWDRPTRCPALTVRSLCVHLMGALRLQAALVSQPADAPPTLDRASLWRVRPPLDRAAVDEVTQRTAQAMTPEELRLGLAEAAAAFSEAVRARPPNALCGQAGLGVAAVADVVAAVTVETAVHTMDIGHATLRGERIHPAAVGVVTGTLDALLAAPLPRALGWDARTYILTGTGRRRLEPNERLVLGELADRFPLLS